MNSQKKCFVFIALDDTHKTSLFKKETSLLLCRFFIVKKSVGNRIVSEGISKRCCQCYKTDSTDWNGIFTQLLDDCSFLSFLFSFFVLPHFFKAFKGENEYNSRNVFLSLKKAKENNSTSFI